MRYKRIPVPTLICLLLLVLIPTSCEPLFYFQVENQTGETLLDYSDGYQISTIEAGQTAECKIQGSAGRYLIEVKNAQENVYYSVDVSYEQLKDDKYKIVVTPP